MENKEVHYTLLSMMDLKQKNKSKNTYINNICYVIAGPTASGKTGLSIKLALKLQEETGRGVAILNADSLQIYKGLPLLTACPSKEEKEQVPHLMFEILEPQASCSVAFWWEEVNRHIQSLFKKEIIPIVVGGTGFYIESLIKGLPQTPEVHLKWRNEAQKHLDEIGHNAFYEELKKIDPLLALKLSPSDTQRVIRGWEVFHATGTPLSLWQEKEFQQQEFDIVFDYIQLMPPREWLYERCERRFDLMLQEGALEEVEQFTQTYGTDAFPVCKALGFYEIRNFLKGIENLESAILLAKQKTRNYAKRQLTWQRNKMQTDRLGERLSSFQVLEKPDIEKLINIETV